jgi:rRNA maturation endonuclease Nob1
MVLDRLRRVFGTLEEDDRELYRCVNCGKEYERPHRECSACGGPFVAPVDGSGRNA